MTSSVPLWLRVGDLVPAIAQYLNVAAYHFSPLYDLDTLRHNLRSEGKRLGIKGTILLTPEGINLFICAREEQIDQFMAIVRQIDGLAELPDKRSWSDKNSFRRFLVKIKSEIIAFGIEGIEPGRYTSARISAHELDQWLSSGKKVHLLDTRNDYEVEVGTFDGAVPVGVDHFRDFPAAVRQLPEEWKDEPVVTFCTGGIRCEKAAPFMERMGFKQIYQLDGGILKYFEEVGGRHWHGDCFVFDQRVSVKPDLSPGDLAVCFACQAVLNPEDIASPLFQKAISCPHCWKSDEQKMASLLQERKQTWDQITDPLPGSEPYTQRRPLRVSHQHAGMNVLDYLASLSTPYDRAQWEKELDEGTVVREEEVLNRESIVQPGQPLAHLLYTESEPTMSRAIEFLYEDEDWIVIDKPAPIAVHPSGRFCRHSLVWLLSKIYAPEKPRPAHRLDVATTGVMVFTKTRLAASRTQRQFELGTAQKFYLALVTGHPTWDEHTHSAAIARQSDDGYRTLDPEGRESVTEFRVLERRGNGTSLIEARPLTGRTNQIRLHLADLGLPIVGDTWYGVDKSERTAEPTEPLALHAYRLRLQHPRTGEWKEFIAKREL